MPIFRLSAALPSTGRLACLMRCRVGVEFDAPAVTSPGFAEDIYSRFQMQAGLIEKPAVFGPGARRGAPRHMLSRLDCFCLSTHGPPPQLLCRWGGWPTCSRSTFSRPGWRTACRSRWGHAAVGLKPLLELDRSLCAPLPPALQALPCCQSEPPRSPPRPPTPLRCASATSTSGGWCCTT